MHLHFDNVNDAFYQLVQGIYLGDNPHVNRGIGQLSIPTTAMESRAGRVLSIEEPMVLTYANPCKRVLLNPERDANPFFHLVEALWMLAGRNDVATLQYYNSKIADIASDDGETFNGAYGYRWAIGGIEGTVPAQLEVLIDHLRDKPESRRAVLQMWNVEDDLTKLDASKDVCCNLSVLFKIRKKEFIPKGYTGTFKVEQFVLDMTVLNRSNDLVWGCLGANYVHFSFLQEYMAAAIGVGVGSYSQVTNNLHVYESNWKPTTWLSKTDTGYPVMADYVPVLENYEQLETFHDYLEEFLTYSYELGTAKDSLEQAENLDFGSRFLQDVAKPMVLAFAYWKERKDKKKALEWAERVAANDWKLAAREWLVRRITKAESKVGAL